MMYSRVFVDAIGYELPPVVVTSEELESRLRPSFEALRIPRGQLEAITGIGERRWWEEGFPVSRGAVAAGRRALEIGGVAADRLDVLIYAGVCREQFEPATACRVAAELGVGPSAWVFDVSNACLGVLNGMIDVANRIELGQARAGLVVACESAREINDIIIEKMLASPDLETFRLSLATLTGGSGAAAVLLTDGSSRGGGRHRLIGGATRSAPEFHGLCRWGIEPAGPMPAFLFSHYTRTDAPAVLKNGVELGSRTWDAFLGALGWSGAEVDRVVCHQVGAGHREAVLRALGVPEEKDFATFPFLGNVGTVSLPLTAALAEERDLLRRGQRVGFLGIGSGLNCMMLGLDW